MSEMTESEVWVHIAAAMCVVPGVYVADAAAWADAMLEEYRKRFVTNTVYRGRLPESNP